MSAAATRAIVEQVVAAWAARDLARLLALTDESIAQEIRVAGSETPVSPPAVGREMVAAKWQAILAAFDFAAVESEVLAASDDSARAAVHLVYVHKASGERIEGRGHIDFALADGRIVRMVEYYDLPALTAFGRLMAAGG